MLGTKGKHNSTNVVSPTTAQKIATGVIEIATGVKHALFLTGTIR